MTVLAVKKKKIIIKLHIQKHNTHTEGIFNISKSLIILLNVEVSKTRTVLFGGKNVMLPFKNMKRKCVLLYVMTSFKLK